jgi:hypothetical protein
MGGQFIKKALAEFHQNHPDETPQEFVENSEAGERSGSARTERMRADEAAASHTPPKTHANR